MTETRDLSPHEYAEHFSRQTRRSMRRLAETLGIDPAAHPDPHGLWGAISAGIAAGVPSPRSEVAGDPFAVFVTRECPRCGPQTLVVPTTDGGPVDESVRDEMIRYVLAHEPKCRDCNEQMPGNFSAEMTRMSVFGDRARKVAIT